jgi:isopentenyl-diphosphate Delta-isomerase
MSRNKVILVTNNDLEVGICDKLEAHQQGLLHRAFSVLVYNAKGEVLLQKRAKTKYHSAGLWSNTCCSHPQPNEDLLTAAHERLQEEMGFDCVLVHKGHFVYHAQLENDLVEHELDHVFVGLYEGNPTPNPEEAEDYRWQAVSTLKKQIEDSPQSFSCWFSNVLQICEQPL